MVGNVQNNSSFAADNNLNGTQPLSDWVIERLRKNSNQRQVGSQRVSQGSALALGHPGMLSSGAPSTGN